MKLAWTSKAQIKSLFFAGVSLFLLGVSQGFSDEVIFKSGDRLTGKILSIVEGKMAFDSKVAGEITLDINDIQTFSTDEPLDMLKPDGTVEKVTIAKAEDGSITAIAEGADPKKIAVAEMANITPPEKPRWKGAIMAGVTFVRGNTKSTAANIEANTKLRREKDRITLAGGHYYAKQRDNSTRTDSTMLNSSFLKGQYDYFLSDKTYLLGNLHAERDRIADLELRFTGGAGIGYQWIEKDILSFATEVGIVSISERYRKPSDERHNMAANLAYHLESQLNDKVTAFHNLEFLPSLERSDTFLANGDIGLRAAITASLAFEAKAQMAYNSHPAPERDKKDIRYILGLGWTF